MKYNLVGKKFDRLTVIADSGERNTRCEIIWECRCDCGNTRYYRTNKLTSGRAKSCGCIMQEIKRQSEKSRKHKYQKPQSTLPSSNRNETGNHLLQITITEYQYRKISAFCERNNITFTIQRYLQYPSRVQILIDKDKYFTFLNTLKFKDRIEWQRSD